MRYWENINLKIATYRASGDAHPDLAWRILLCLFGAGLLVVALSGYITYNWANSTDPASQVVGHGPRVSITAKDVEDVLGEYRAKKAEFERLKKEKPVPPALGRGAAPSGTAFPVPIDTSVE